MSEQQMIDARDKIDSIVTWVIPEEVVDERIDVGAQLAILRLAWSPDPRTRAAGAYLLAAVKSGAVDGIQAGERSDDAPDAAAWIHDQDHPVIMFDRSLRFTIPKLDEVLAEVALAHMDTLRGQSREALEARFATFGGNPWSCAAVCLACGGALIDGVPFDELPICWACIQLCSTATAAKTEKPVFLTG